MGRRVWPNPLAHARRSVNRFDAIEVPVQKASASLFPCRGTTGSGAAWHQERGAQRAAVALPALRTAAPSCGAVKHRLNCWPMQHARAVASRVKHAALLQLLQQFIHARPGGADHLRERRLRDRRDDQLAGGWVMPRKQGQRARETRLGVVQNLVYDGILQALSSMSQE